MLETAWPSRRRKVTQVYRVFAATAVGALCTPSVHWYQSHCCERAMRVYSGLILPSSASGLVHKTTAAAVNVLLSEDGAICCNILHQHWQEAADVRSRFSVCLMCKEPDAGWCRKQMECT